MSRAAILLPSFAGSAREQALMALLPVPAAWSMILRIIWSFYRAYYPKFTRTCTHQLGSRRYISTRDEPANWDSSGGTLGLYEIRENSRGHFTNLGGRERERDFSWF